MKIIEKKLGNIIEYEFENKNDIMFFDIETTGLDARSSVLYLIGAVYYENSNWQFIQWFAEECDDEELILNAFFDKLSTKKYLIHYNGNGFDIPYINKKIKYLKINHSFDNIESIDLYKICKMLKKHLNLENCKLKTLEKYYGIYREDIYSGKELIDVYKQYIKINALEKITNDKANGDTIIKDLLLHNEEDIINLLKITKICYFNDLIKGKVVFDEYLIDGSELIVKYHTNYDIPISKEQKYIIITDKDNKDNNECNIKIVIEKNTITIRMLILKGELKYFYPDYKNYYYLPKEDVAIHKSVAQYVDKEYREPAKNRNCYIKKEGEFIVSFNKGLDVFKEDYNKKQTYNLLEDIITSKEIEQTFALIGKMW